MPRRAAVLALATVLAGPAAAREIASARFIAPTEHYDHGILGDAVEYSGMMVTLDDGGRFLVGFSTGGPVFEDLAPRLWDVTGDGAPEIVVVETDPPRGAQLAIYGLRDDAVQKIAATPHIGQTHRWLAPVGAADLDGDGRVEIAFVDRPHLAKTLRVWRFGDGRLTEVAALDGVTNHQIGWDFITGGLRDCGDGPEMVLASGDWRRLVAVRFDGRALTSRDLGRSPTVEAFEQARACR